MNWEQMRCGLADCGEPLHIVLTFDRALYVEDTAEDIADPSGHHTSSWEVVCERGHVVLLPPDTANDSYTFGECQCEPTDPDGEADCGHGDMARLRRVLLPAVPGPVPTTEEEDK